MVAVDQPHGGLSAAVLVNITVLDINDNNPQFHDLVTPISFPENTKGQVIQIHTSDPDLGRNGLVSLTPYSDGNLFGVTMVRESPVKL